MRRSIVAILLCPVMLPGAPSAAASSGPTATVRARLGGISFQRPAGWTVFPYGRLRTQFVTFLGCIGSDPNPGTCGNAPPAMRRGSITILVNMGSFLYPPGRKPDPSPRQTLRVDGHPARLRVLGKPAQGDDCAARDTTLEMTATVADIGRPPADN